MANVNKALSRTASTLRATISHPIELTLRYNTSLYFRGMIIYQCSRLIHMIIIYYIIIILHYSEKNYCVKYIVFLSYFYFSKNLHYDHRGKVVIMQIFIENKNMTENS